MRGRSFDERAIVRLRWEFALFLAVPSYGPRGGALHIRYGGSPVGGCTCCLTAASGRRRHGIADALGKKKGRGGGDGCSPHLPGGGKTISHLIVTLHRHPLEPELTLVPVRPVIRL